MDGKRGAPIAANADQSAEWGVGGHLRQIFPAELLQESGEPGMVPRISCRWLYCTQGHPPRYDPVLLRTIRGRTGQHSIQLVLYAGFVRKISVNGQQTREFLLQEGSKLGR